MKKWYKTFDEWSAWGYTVMKGSKAKRIDGRNVFSNMQVKPYKGKGLPSKSIEFDNDMSPDGLDVDDMSGMTGEPCAMSFYS